MTSLDVYSLVTEEKSTWGPGPWQNEPDHKSWTDTATGLPCLAHRAMHSGHWCGYVAVFPSHPAHGQDYSSLDVTVHGGLTYGQWCQDAVCHIPAPDEPDDVWWLGFDCCHSGDLAPRRARLDELGDYSGLSGHDHYRTLEYVEEQCAELAKQLLALKEAGK